MLGLGVTPTQILQEAVGSADDPASGGRQMPCHWGYKWLNVVTQSSATGAQCLPAVGCAEAARYLSRRRNLPGCKAHGDELTYVSLGEGATSQGEFWESLNTACTLHLPVLYIVADNGYAISVPSSDQSPAPVSELVRGFRGLDIHKVDGRDYFASRKMATEVLPRVRAGVGPALIHATVTRPYSHSAADTQSKYRPAEELADEAAHDPIKLLREELIGAGVITGEEADRIREEARQIVADAAKEALASRRPDPASVSQHVYVVPNVAPEAETTDDGTGEVVAFGEAIKRTLHEQMARDQRIRVFGEDVADAREAVLANVEGKGGVFGTTYGLQREFGLARCYNTPLAEANIIGRAVGQALRGLRPAPEIQFFDYIWTAVQQIKTQAATIRWRSNGAFCCPMVIRVPIGGYLTGGAIWHSQCGESIFAHVPGLIVLMPSRARDAVGLLRTAFQCTDPVMFLEHKHLLRQPYTRDPFPSKGFQIPLGSATVVQPGARHDHRDLRGDGREVPPGGGAAGRDAGRLHRDHRPALARAVGPRPGGRVGRPYRPRRRRPRGCLHLRVRRRGGGVDRRALLRRPRRPGPPRDRHRHPRGLRAHARARNPPPGQRYRGRVRGHVGLLRSWPSKGPGKRGVVVAQTVRGVVARSRGEKVVVTDIVIPDPGPGEAVVKVAACGVCHTDLHYREGAINDDFPFLLGHEAAGTVEAVGDGVTIVAPGDYVVLAWRAPCGTCRSCRRGRPWYCFASQNAAQPMTLVDGTVLAPALGIGAFAERTLVAAAQCVPVDRSARPEAAGLIGCGVMAGFGAAVNTGGGRPGATRWRSSAAGASATPPSRAPFSLAPARSSRSTSTSGSWNGPFVSAPRTR